MKTNPPAGVDLRLSQYNVTRLILHNLALEFCGEVVKFDLTGKAFVQFSNREDCLAFCGAVDSYKVA